MRNEDVVQAIIEAVNGRIDARFDKLIEILSSHETRLVVLENHDSQTRKVLEQQTEQLTEQCQQLKLLNRDVEGKSSDWDTVKGVVVHVIELIIGALLALLLTGRVS